MSEITHKLSQEADYIEGMKEFVGDPSYVAGVMRQAADRIDELEDRVELLRNILGGALAANSHLHKILSKANLNQ